MLTDDLTRALAEAAERRTFPADLTVALDRARRRIRRRRCARAGVALSVACLAGSAATALVNHDSDSSVPLAGGAGLRSAGGPVFGPQPFTAPQDRSAERKPGAARCAFNIDLGAAATPRRIAMPCTATWTADPSRSAPMSRQDRVSIDGRTWLITSGVVPAQAVSVTAVGANGTPLTATLVHLDYAPQTAFVIRSTGHGVRRLQYQLADGRTSQYNDVSTP